MTAKHDPEQKQGELTNIPQIVLNFGKLNVLKKIITCNNTSQKKRPRGCPFGKQIWRDNHLEHGLEKRIYKFIPTIKKFFWWGRRGEGKVGSLPPPWGRSDPSPPPHPSKYRKSTSDHTKKEGKRYAAQCAGRFFRSSKLTQILKVF